MTGHDLEHPVPEAMHEPLRTGEAVWVLTFCETNCIGVVEFRAIAVISGIIEFKDAVSFAVHTLGVDGPAYTCSGVIRPREAVPSSRVNTLIGETVEDLVLFQRQMALLLLKLDCLSDDEGWI